MCVCVSVRLCCHFTPALKILSCVNAQLWEHSDHRGRKWEGHLRTHTRSPYTHACIHTLCSELVSVLDAAVASVGMEVCQLGKQD